MLKNISNVGTALDREELKSINGGFSTVDCHAAHTECDLCHPDNHDDFINCMIDLGCMTAQQ